MSSILHVNDERSSVSQMSAALDWRVYYDDGSTFDNLDGGWLDAPAWGVQSVVVSYEDHPGVIYEGDYYFIPPKATLPYAGDVWGVIDKLIVDGHMTADERLDGFHPNYLIECGIKFGRMMDRPTYLDLKRRIIADAKEWRRNPEGITKLDSRHTEQPWTEEVNA